MFELSLPHQAYSFPIARNMENWSSFPSDTSAYFFALGFGLIHLLRRHSVLITLYTAVWICLPRMFLGEHYLTDIAVGAAIGIALVIFSLRSKWLQRIFTSPILRLMEAKPQIFYATAFLILFEMAALFDDVRVAARGLFHVLRSGHARELFPVALAGFGFLALVAIVAFVRRRPSASSQLHDDPDGERLSIDLAALSKREELLKHTVRREASLR
jgi:hypothetical protein